MNTEVLIGVPADPIPESVTENIAAVIREIPDIAFAFLPEMYIPGQMEDAGPVLILVTALDGKQLDNTMNKLRIGINDIIPDGIALDMLPVPPDSELLPAVFETGCLVEINDHNVFTECQKLK